MILIGICFAFRNELGMAEGGHSYTSIEELKNIWIPYSIKMKLSKNKELEVYNWDESSEVKYFSFTRKYFLKILSLYLT